MIVKASEHGAQTAIASCAHCGLPVPAGLVKLANENQFCCHGCAGAYQLISTSGLRSFYEMAGLQSDATLKNRNVVGTRYEEFDSQLFLDKFTQTAGDGLRQIKLTLEGLHCAACIWLLEKLPNIVPGVVEARVNWSRGTIRLKWQPGVVDLSEIASKLFQLGYTAHPIHESEKQRRFQRENRRHLSRLGIAAALAGNNMIVSAALYFGMFAHMTAGITHLMRITSCLLGIIALLLPGRIFLKSAWQAIRTRTPHMDLPIALALSVGTTIGMINVIRGAGEIYFDTLSVLIFLLLIGRWLQFRQQARAADAVEMLYRMTPQSARKIINGRAVETLVDLISIGDELEIRSGELIPVDGIIREGESQLDESILTGESVSVYKAVGDKAFAGTLNTASVIRIEATEIGDDTRLSKIAQLVEDAGENRPEIVQWTNQIGGYFVMAVLLLAAFTLFYWLPISFEVAVERTMALLIVACPCALALATPLAIAVALGRSAKSGIMVKSGDVLQSLQRPGMIWLDKTGTLTEGNLRVEKWHGDESCLPLIAVAELHSHHPVGRALLRYVDSQNLHDGKKDHDFNQIEEHVGAGVVATIDDRNVLIGNRQLLEDQQVRIPSEKMTIADQYLNDGFSPCWIAVDNEVRAVAAVADAIRPDAISATTELMERGWKLGILSGDHQGVVDRVAKRIGIEPEMAVGEATPEKKLEIIQGSLNQTTLMVGDGANDSAALAAANVGLAVKGSAEASLASAPVYLARPGLEPILSLLDLSDSTTRTMHRNLAVSLVYNIGFAALAFAGFVNPYTAAILMPVSSLTVVSLSLQSGKVIQSIDEVAR